MGIQEEAGMKGFLNNWLADILDLSAFGIESDSVVRDTAGIPVAWRVLKVGPWTLSQNGVAYSGEIVKEHLKSIADWYALKGEQIPLDSEHALKAIADALGTTEADPRVIAVFPGGKGPCGWGALELRADGDELWFQSTKITDALGEAFKQGMIKYFSPVIRGLKEGQLRITSMSHVSVPGINGLPSLTLAAETAATNPERIQTMNEILKALGLPETATPAEALAAVNALKEKAGAAGDALGLAGENNKSDRIKLEIVGLKEKAAKADTLQIKVNELTLAADKAKKDELIADLKKNGKLTDAMLPWAEKLDVVSLSEFAKTAAVIVSTQASGAGKDRKQDDAIVLTAEQKQVAQSMGLTEEQYRKGLQG